MRSFSPNRTLKALAVLLCMLLSSGILARNYLRGEDPPLSLKKTERKERWLKGQIDGKYAITLFLEFDRYSGASADVYAVRGFYYYDKYKQRIPLVGMYYNGLVLYQFSAAHSKKFLEDFEPGASNKNFWDELEAYRNLQGFTEKFQLDEAESYWQKGDKKLSVTMEVKDLRILAEKEYLVWKREEKKDTIGLSIVLPDRDLKLVRFSENGSSLKVLLYYSYNSRSYALGMCGAGIESGYLVLSFDRTLNLVGKERLALESCLENIYGEILPSDQPKQKVFRVTMENGTKDVVLDVEQMSIHWK